MWPSRSAGAGKGHSSRFLRAEVGREDELGRLRREGGELGFAAAVEAAPMQDETILFNPATNKFCVLNPSAALVWQSLETPQPAQVLASQLCEAFEGVTQDQARRDVETALLRLQSLALVETHSS